MDLLINRLVPGVQLCALRRILWKKAINGSGHSDGCGRNMGQTNSAQGIKASIEGAVHTMWELFEVKAGTGLGPPSGGCQECINSVNREAVLWNAREGIHGCYLIPIRSMLP